MKHLFKWCDRCNKVTEHIRYEVLACKGAYCRDCANEIVPLFKRELFEA